MYNGIRIIFGYVRVPEKLNTFFILSWAVWKYTCDNTDTGYKYIFQTFLNLLPSLAQPQLSWLSLFEFQLLQPTNGESLIHIHFCLKKQFSTAVAYSKTQIASFIINLLAIFEVNWTELAIKYQLAS